MWKGNIWFFFQQEGEIGSKKTESEAQEKWVKEEGDQENKRSSKNGNEKQRWMRNVMNKNKEWWTKDARNTWWKKKRMFFMWEIFFNNKKTGDFFGTQKRDKTNKRSLCSQKFLDWNEENWKRRKK